MTTSIALCKRFIVSFKHLSCTLQEVYREHYHLRCTLPEVYREISAAAPSSFRSAAELVLLILFLEVTYYYWQRLEGCSYEMQNPKRQFLRYLNKPLEKIQLRFVHYLQEETLPLCRLEGGQIALHIPSFTYTW